MSKPILALVTLCICLPLPAQADTMNISQFIFRDENGNGVFDTGEGPLSGIPVTLMTDAGPITRASNVNGFANFELSPDGAPGEVVTEPGEVTLRFPEIRGLVRTTPDARASTVRRVEGSPSGLVMDPPFEFLGYAIHPVVEVHLPPGFDADELYCELAGQVYRAWTGEDRRVCAVPADAAWQELVLSLNHGDETIELARIVPGFQRVIASFSAGFIAAARDHSTPQTTDHAALTLDFEDIISANDVYELPAHQSGLVFHNLIVAHRLYYNGYGYVNGTTSGEFSVYTSSGHPARIASPTPFELESVNMGVAWPQGQQGMARVTGSLDGEVVAELALSLTNLHASHVLFFWGPVDLVGVSHDLYWQIVLDDLTVRTNGDARQD
ncbi:hypothetical protein HKCCSP123_16990 [Rhodobacterales bacterium HKCCSP123]|nr:hypothetical protein [Rhodobacterales bacterium HKCCSP123]